MDIPPELFQLITEFAWNQKITKRNLLIQINCCMDCRRNIPDWFKTHKIHRLNFINNIPIMETKKNPLVQGHPFSPICARDIEYNRNIYTLLRYIQPTFWKRKKLYKAATHKLVKRSILATWNTLVERLGEISMDDLDPQQTMVDVIVNSMVLSLQTAGLICRWKPFSHEPPSLPTAP